MRFASNGKKDVKPTPDSDRPDEETVRRLAEQARQAESMWNTLVPERNIDWRGVLGLMALIGALHTYNSYNMQREVERDTLPPGAKEQIANGVYLMTDGSIQQIEFTPEKVKVREMPKESPMLLDKILGTGKKE